MSADSPYCVGAPLLFQSKQSNSDFGDWICSSISEWLVRSGFQTAGRWPEILIRTGDHSFAAVAKAPAISKPTIGRQELIGAPRINDFHLRKSCGFRGTAICHEDRKGAAWNGAKANNVTPNSGRSVAMVGRPGNVQ